jgi:hypothetical protein
MTGQRHSVLLCPHYEDVAKKEQEPARGRDGRERRDPKFEVQGSKFRKPRTSDLEPSPVPPVSRSYPAEVVRLTSRSAVLYDADKKMAQGQAYEAKGFYG